MTSDINDAPAGQTPKWLLLLLPITSIVAWLFCITFIAILIGAILKKRVNSFDYSTIISRTIADTFTTILVGMSTWVVRRRDDHATDFIVVALLLHVATFGFVQNSTSYVVGIFLRHSNVLRSINENLTFNVLLTVISAKWLISVLYTVTYAFVSEAVIDTMRGHAVCKLASCPTMLMVVFVVLGIVSIFVIGFHWLVLFKVKQARHKEWKEDKPETSLTLRKLVAYGSPLLLYTVTSALSIVSVIIAWKITKADSVESHDELLPSLVTVAAVTVNLWCLRIINDVICTILADYRKLLPFFAVKPTRRVKPPGSIELSSFY
ncbi:unnamed protein product [Caenorhabditis auriculariae]|uniref:Uncharacterized protein n=1 Tax=Caenorhabditis auriculariae TaxID=2777116 RepID=A0A8S1HGN3_9PELO|nr:unnamed protein product [Caenorhabditis auriculariae]